MEARRRGDTFDGGDATFDGGTPRCAIDVVRDIVDDLTLSGHGFDLVARANTGSNDYVVAYAADDSSLITPADASVTPVSNIFLRSVSSAGTLGATTPILNTDTLAPLLDPSLTALTGGSSSTPNESI